MSCVGPWEQNFLIIENYVPNRTPTHSYTASFTLRTQETSPAGPHYIYTRSHASLGFWMAGRSVVDLPLTSKKRACGCNGVLGPELLLRDQGLSS